MCLDVGWSCVGVELLLYSVNGLYLYQIRLFYLEFYSLYCVVGMKRQRHIEGVFNVIIQVAMCSSHYLFMNLFI